MWKNEQFRTVLGTLSVFVHNLDETIYFEVALLKKGKFYKKLFVVELTLQEILESINN